MVCQRTRTDGTPTAWSRAPTTSWALGTQFPSSLFPRSRELCNLPVRGLVEAWPLCPMPLNVVWRWGEQGSSQVLGAPHSPRGKGRRLPLWSALAAESTDPTGAQQRLAGIDQSVQGPALPCAGHLCTWSPKASSHLTAKLLTWMPATRAQLCYPGGSAALCREGSRTRGGLGRWVRLSDKEPGPARLHGRLTYSTPAPASASTCQADFCLGVCTLSPCPQWVSLPASYCSLPAWANVPALFSTVGWCWELRASTLPTLRPQLNRCCLPQNSSVQQGAEEVDETARGDTGPSVNG